jgi:acetylornithine deacetylase
MKAAEILRELVAIPSVSKMSNRSLIGYVSGFLSRQGWATIEIPYTDPAGVEKVNLIALPQGFSASEVELAFACHTDTVPYATSWEKATQLEERGEFLHGCGSCDVKGALAGILAAIASVPSERLKPVALLLTADEEIGCIGATHLIAANRIHPKRVIVCEPTSLHPASAGKGYGLLEVRVTGKEAHSAFPQQGQSAINIAAEFIHRVTSAQPGMQDPLFDPPYTTFNVGVIQGGSAKNIVAGQCSFLIEWRPIPGEPVNAGAELVLQIAKEVETSHPECHIHVNVLRSDCGFKNTQGARLGATLSKLLDRSETGISFGSEATRFAKIAEEVIVVGPGNMHTAHSERECIPIAELEEWTECVKDLLTIC